VLLLDLLHANFRNLKFPQSRLVCLMLLVRMGSYCSDSVILQRAVPILIVALEDQSAPVRATAVRGLRTLISLVRQFSSAESNIFPLYIFPILTRVSKDPEYTVRIAFAESLGTIAETAKRFLDIAHLAALNKVVNEIGSEGISSAATDPSSVSSSAPKGFDVASSDVTSPRSHVTLDPASLGSVSLQFPYDQKLDLIKEQTSRWIRDLTMEIPAAVGSAANSSIGVGINTSVFGGSVSVSGAGMLGVGSAESRRASMVKRVILMDIMRLCVFFGQESSMDRLLTQLLTYLNDQDWELRYAFCAKVPAVCSFLGPTVTAECILPCIENAIYDVEEKVVHCAVNSLTTLVQMGLLSNMFIVDFVGKCRPLLIHPSASLTSATVKFLIAATNALGKIDSAVFVLPLIRACLRFDVSGLEFSEELLRVALVPCIGRQKYRSALFRRLSDLSSAYQLYQSDLFTNGGKDDAENVADGSSVIRDPEMSRGKVLAYSETEEKEKMDLLHPYLDLAAREINTKTLQWRNGLSSTANQLARASLVHAAGKSESVTASSTTNSSTSPRPNVFSLLDMTSYSGADHSLQSLMIPHQKYGIFQYRPLSDDLRKNTVYLDVDGQKNSAKLKSLFGVTLRQSEGVRAVSAGAKYNWEQGIGGDDEPTFPFSSMSSADTESLRLLRRIKALDIPPLPPDTGILMQPTTDNRFYRYFEKSFWCSASWGNFII
jgi:hypothetical protein